VPLIMNKPQPPTIIIQSHDQEIVQQLEQINEHLAEELTQESPGSMPKPKEPC
jgi:hypothetical protein